MTAHNNPSHPSRPHPRTRRAALDRRATSVPPTTHMGEQRTLPLKFARLRTTEPCTQPAKSYPTDAGYDLTASRSVVLEPGAFAQVPTNVAIALPPATWGLLIGRSSTFHRRGLMVNVGVVDSGYRGELMAMVYNPSRSNRVVIQEGERLFQLIVIPATTPDFLMAAVQVDTMDDLPPSERGPRGFGSTGGFKPSAAAARRPKPAADRRRAKRVDDSSPPPTSQSSHSTRRPPSLPPPGPLDR